jgi:hypothetical protein
MNSTGASPEPQDSPEAMRKRLESMKAGLMALHREMYWMVQDQQSPEQEQKIADLNFDQVMDLKLAVDNMRDLLWKYVEAASKVEPRRVQEALEAQRARRVGQLLQLLRERLGRYPDQQQQPVSFIEKVSAVIKEKLAGHGGKAA